MTAFMHKITSFVRDHKRESIGASIGVVLLFAGLLYFWGSGAQEDTVVIASSDFSSTVSVAGTVIAAEAVDLGFTQSGRISGVYAKVGDTVGRGTLLAQIENGDVRAGVLQKEAALETEMAQLSDLEMGTRPEKLAVSEAEVKSAQTALEQENLSVVDALIDAYTKSDSAVHGNASQLFSNPGTSPQLNFAVSNSGLKSDLESAYTAADTSLRVWGDTVSVLSVTSPVAEKTAQDNLATVIRLLSLANSALSSAITNSGNATTIAGYVTDVAAARASVNTASSALTAAIMKRNNALSTLETAQKNLALARAGSTAAEIDAQKAQVKAAQADLDNAKALLQKTLVVAPFPGIVTRMDAKTGEIVSPNTPEISLQSVGTFQIEAYVPEVNIAKLSVGNTATVTLDAYGPSVHFSARVVAIDPAETLRDGVSNYKTTLQFDDADVRIRSGMTADVIITAETKKETIVIPQAALTLRDGKSFVYIKVGDTSEEREVTTGLSSLGKVEILSGLSIGDTVFLSPKP